MSIKILHRGKKISSCFLPFVFLAAFFIPSFVFAQAKTVTGKIMGSDGAPIAGVSVQEKDSNTGTATDASGNFSLSVTKPDASLVISSLGYESQTVDLSGRSNIEITLQASSAKQLEQVVVVGYGTQRKKDLTGAVSVVTSADIANRPIVNAGEALQGKAAGVQ